MSQSQGRAARPFLKAGRTDMEYKTDIEIAQACEKEKITAVAARAGIPEEYLELYGNYKAKIDYKFCLLYTSRCV